MVWAQRHYRQVLIHDGSTLDALLRHVGLLREAAMQPVAGRMAALLDLASRLPATSGTKKTPRSTINACWPQLLAALTAGSLVIFDLGYTNFQVFAQLTAAQVTWLTRAKSNLVYAVVHDLQRRAAVHESFGLDWALTNASWCA